LANLADDKGDQAEAERLYQRVIDICKELGDIVTAGITLFNLALLYEDQGRLDEALPLLERVVDVFERVGSLHAETVRPVLERVREKLGH
jgi:tetratricopeptide (TPR) repeat protein